MRFVSLLAVIAFAAPATAQDVSPASTPKQDKQICRRMGAPTGSMLPGKRVCHSKAEWAEVDAQNRANADRALDLGRRQSARPAAN